MAQRIRFYADEHIHRAAIEQLQEQGVDIVHCADVGMLKKSDQEHLAYATENQRVIVTCDDDFQRWDSWLKEEGETHYGIVYFSMAKDLCKDIGTIVKEILFLHEAAEYENDLYNQVWRVKK